MRVVLRRYTACRRNQARPAAAYYDPRAALLRSGEPELAGRGVSVLAAAHPGRLPISTAPRPWVVPWPMPAIAARSLTVANRRLASGQQ